jgi:hypothetical protein
MSADERIEKIEKIEKAGESIKSVEGGIDGIVNIDRLPPNKERFDSLVNNSNNNNISDQKSTRSTVTERVEPVSQTSLMDEMRKLNVKVDRIHKINPKDLVAQADEAVKQIDKIKSKLATPNLELKPATQSLLQNKLSHIDENLRIALSKAGVEYKPSSHLDNKTVNPIERFLGFLTNGQEQLASMGNELNDMHLNGKDLSPANMLRIQMKVGYITQEIEFFTAVLNKALESTKTIMNVQV